MFNTTLTTNYFKHILSAKSRHGTHSPFVYRLLDEVIYNFKDKAGYKKIENLRAELLQDERIIAITDLGAGSYVDNKKKKKVKTLAKNALKSRKLAQLLFRLADEFKPKTLIELGTCLGVTTSYFSLAIPHGEVITLEGCPETAAVAKENWKKLGLHNINVIVGNFDQTLPEVIAKEDQLDFIFIDGNHRKDATLEYFNLCLPKVHEGSVIIFDDIYWSSGMKEAWNHIKAHPDVSISVDLFWVGMVFFRTGQAKQDFKIRF